MSTALDYGYTPDLLVRVTCCNCGAAFGITGTLYAARRDDRENFHCPNGHPQHFTGKTAAERLREDLDAEKRRHEMTKRDRDNERFRANVAARGKAIVRGRLLAERRRAKAKARAGLCPAKGCRRHFKNLARHMETKHQG